MKITNDVFFSSKAQALIEVTKSNIEPDTDLGVRVTANPWAIWGIDNDYPQQIVDENSQDTTSSGALGFKIKAHFGMGLYLYKRRVENDKEIITPAYREDYPEVDEFFYQNDIENFQEGIVTDFEWFNQCYSQLIPNKARTRIVGINRIPTVKARLAIKDTNTGKIPAVYVSADWPQPVLGKYATLPVFDRRNPFAHPNAVFIHKQPSVDKEYYPTPLWYSNIRWLKVAKKIPAWIGSNIENSINLKYHIEIPEEYFTALYPPENYESTEEHEKAITEAKAAKMKEMDDFLAGEENVMKTFYSFFALDDNGNPLPGWKITPITNDIKDQAWLQAYGTAAAAIATAHQVPPDLTGLILTNSLSGGSGSNVREQFNHYVQMHTVIPRQTTLEWWDVVKRANNWPRELHLGYKNIILQTVDNAKGGFQVQNESNTTTTNKD